MNVAIGGGVMNCPRLFCSSLLRDETKAFPFWCANWVIGIVFYVKRESGLLLVGF
jgi:hypothetical protein